MQLEDWLDDLCVRFIINLPREELESVERICFQVEEAQWFYEDFIRPLDPNLPSLSLRAFALRIFQHCPLMSQWSHYHHSTAFSEFLAYKTRVPVRGAILLNQAMDEVVLVKGWKKGANWSFPRGKINKDEKDLDCAIREVYEETGFDIKGAGLINDEKDVKYIEIPMREQNMRLYVLRGVPMGTHFEPRTRKEISKIEWYKLSELPTLKKNRQLDANGQHINGNVNKFYMVAPFLVPLKKWIAQQRKIDLAHATNTGRPLQLASTREDVSEEERADTVNAEPPPKQRLVEPQIPSDLPEVSVAQDPSAHLKRLLNISNLVPLPHNAPSEPGGGQTPLLNPDVAKGSALLALLRKGSEPVGQRREQTQTAMVQPPYHPEAPRQPQPHTGAEGVITDAPPSSHHHIFPETPGIGVSMIQPHIQHANQSHTPNYGYAFTNGTPFYHHQPHQQQVPFPPFTLERPPASGYIANRPPPLRTFPQYPFDMSTQPPVGQIPALDSSKSLRQTLAPYQRTGDPQFAQTPQFPNLHAPSVPPASKLPPPKLTSHSLALLSVFKNEAVKNNDDVTSKPPSRLRVEDLSSGRKSQHQESLLSLLKKPSVTSTTAAPTELPARAELAALSSPPVLASSSEPSAIPSGVPTSPFTPLKSQPPLGAIRDSEGITSATVLGPLNLPHFEGLPKSKTKHPVAGSPRSTRKNQPMSRSNVVILPRPNSAIKESPSAIQNAPIPLSPPNQKVKLSDLTKPFQPKILRRPIKGDLDASLPTHTVAVSAFSQPENEKPLERQEEQPTEMSYDRRPSQSASQKETLLALFGKPVASTSQPSAEPEPLKSPPRSAGISSLGSSPPVDPRSRVAQLSASRLGTVSSAGASKSQAASRSKATSPVDKAFLLSYLEGVAKGER